MEPHQGNRLGKLLYPSIYREGKGDLPPFPARGPKLFFYLLGNYFFKLIALNLLSLALCLPLVTIPATICALSRVMMKLALQGYCSIYQEYFAEWRAALLRYLPFSLVSAAPAAIGIGLIYARISTLSGLAGFMLLAVCALIFLFVYLLWCYAFPLFAMIDLPVWQNVRNALFFAATQRKANLVLLLPLAIAGLCITFLPWSAPLAVLFSLSMLSLMICCIVKPPIDEYVIQPYLKQAEPSADISQ